MARLYTILLMAMALTSFGANAVVMGDVNGDGEVTIADVNAVIDMILAGDVDSEGCH